MNRTQKFLKNTLTTALLQIVTMITGFILPKIMLTVYGSEINGLVSSITQFISYLTLVEAGLSGATVYSLYKPIAEKDTVKINQIITAARNFYYKTGYIFVGLIMGGALLYPMFIKSGLLSPFNIGLLFVILGINGVLEFFTLAKYRALLTADQKTYVISLVNIVHVIFNCVIISILSYIGVSIVIVRAIALISILLRTIMLWIYCKNKYSYLDFSVTPDNSALSKRWDALYMQIISVIHMGSPVVIATCVLSLNEVSIYSIYHVVINGINAVMSIFVSGLAAGFGDLLARNEKNRFKDAFQQFEYIYYILITLVFSVMMLTYIPFIRIYTEGADINYIYPTFAFLLAINGYFNNLKTPYGMLTISAGKYKESRMQISTQAALEVVLGFILAHIWGLNGIILGTIISHLYRNVDFIFFAPKHLIEHRFKESLVMWVRSIGAFVVVITIASLIPNSFVTGYIEWIVYASIITIISIILIFSINLVLDYKRFKSCYYRIKSLLVKKRSKISKKN